MLNFLVPKFLKNLDKHLLLNHPLLWITKIHYLVYFTMILWVLTAGIGCLIPINLTNLVDTALYYTFFTIIAVVLLCVWIFKNAIFNIERSFGNRSFFDEYKVFFIYFICVYLLFTFSYPFAYVYNYRIAHTISDEELVNDLNTLNVADPFFVRSYYDYDENHKITDSTDGEANYIYLYDINKYHAWGKFTPYQLANDSLSAPGLMSNSRLENRFKTIEQNESASLQAIKAYLHVLNKYNISLKYSANDVLNNYHKLCEKPIENPNTVDAVYFNDYDINFNQIETITRNITDAKYSKLFIFKEDFNIVIFYFVFYIVIFFMMFRNVNWQQFLITIVTLIILPILLFIFGQFFEYSSFLHGDKFFFDVTILIYLFCLGKTIYNSLAGKTFSGFTSICTQLVNLLTPVIFAIIIEILRGQTDEFNLYGYNEYSAALETANETPNYSEIYNAQLNGLLRDYNYNKFHFWQLGSLIFGIAFYIIAFMPFMKEQFVKLKALPRNH